jgi:hypothetical protein
MCRIETSDRITSQPNTRSRACSWHLGSQHQSQHTAVELDRADTMAKISTGECGAIQAETRSTPLTRGTRFITRAHREKRELLPFFGYGSSEELMPRGLTDRHDSGVF